MESIKFRIQGLGFSSMPSVQACALFATPKGPILEQPQSTSDVDERLAGRI